MQSNGRATVAVGGAIVLVAVAMQYSCLLFNLHSLALYQPIVAHHLRRRERERDRERVSEREREEGEGEPRAKLSCAAKCCADATLVGAAAVAAAWPVAPADAAAGPRSSPIRE